ncbi:hypothetical protein PIB30_082228 [Stylosanthes scabra]|uniref:Uncharacterized protein n=1 Tax=Stylosanthes scabra TaxID=79078 RepID=A0ABU6VUJ9_9FABA|nr:hypothetical protein [Stylosanthes scabra]
MVISQTHEELMFRGSGFQGYLDTVIVKILFVAGKADLMSIFHVSTSGVPGLRVSELLGYLLGSRTISVAGLPVKWSKVGGYLGPEIRRYCATGFLVYGCDLATGELTRGTWLRSYGGHLPESEQSFAREVIGERQEGHLKETPMLNVSRVFEVRE